MSPLDYLVIAAHPDDAELGVGGTMLLLRAEGASVGVLDLTDGEPTPYGSSGDPSSGDGCGDRHPGLSLRGNLGLTNREG